jgi:hypothetical protein
MTKKDALRAGYAFSSDIDTINISKPLDTTNT